MKILSIISVIFYLASHCAVGQNKQNFNWQIQNSGTSSTPVSAALNFDNCEPTVINNSFGSGFEGQSSISDSETGALLLYTDGYVILNANHQVMQNGSGAGLSNSCAQTIIIKKPGSNNLFYVFTPDVQAGLVQNINFPGVFGIKYAEVDMTLNGGLGGVTSTFNPIKPAGNCEMLTGVYHANGQDVWLIGHEYGNNNFFTFLITAAGISPAPAITSAGPVVFTFQPGIPGDSNLDAIGELKASPDGSKLAFTTYFNGYTCLVDFNNATGAISNPMELSLDGGGYGTSFSPDNTKLYFSSLPIESFNGVENNSIYQFDISSNDPVTIQNSRTTIFNYEAGFRSLKLGPDGKIYVARTTNVQLGNGASYLGVINEPNNAGAACNYVHDGVFLNGPYGAWGLNNSIEDLYSCNDFQFSLGPDLVLCPGEPAVLSAIAGQTNYLWNTGQTTSSITVSQPGTYFVTATGAAGTASDTLVVTTHLVPDISITGLATICQGETTELVSTSGFDDYLWTNGSASNSTIVGEGEWSVSATDSNGCINTATYTVSNYPQSELNISGLSNVCEDELTELTANGGFTEYLWSNGADTNEVTVGQGEWSVSALDANGCASSAVFVVEQLEQPIAKISGLEESCEGVPVNLFAEEYANQTLTWNAGQTESSIWVETSGTYTVTASNFCGSSADSLTVKFKNCECGVFIPNAFTPQGDDINMVWQPIACPAISYEASVYDRWGMKIFHSFDQNNPWIGNVRGGDHYAENGVYSYVITIMIEPGEAKTYRGHVTLIR
jgi:gliding motility-associated-like protein